MADMTGGVRAGTLAAIIAALSIALGGYATLRSEPAQSQEQEFTFALIGDLGYVPGRTGLDRERFCRDQ